MQLLDERLLELHEATPGALIEAIHRDKWNQARLLPVLWCMVATFQVGVDLHNPPQHEQPHLVEAMTAPRPTLSLQPGTEVVFHGRRGYISHLLDFESVLVSDAQTGKPERVRVIDLQPSGVSTPVQHQDPQVIADADWRLAQERFEIIRPLVDPHGRKRADVEARAADTGKHANTLYK